MSQRARAIGAAATGAWWTYIVMDFMTHAVLLAAWWRATAAFWLAPAELVRRIPVAYAGFALYSVGLTVLLAIVHGEKPRVREGLRLGAIVGIVFGVVSALGIYSAVRLPASFLLVGPVSTAVASAGAGAGAAWVLSGSRSWRRVGALVGMGILVLVVGIVIQNALHGQRVG